MSKNIFRPSLNLSEIQILLESVKLLPEDSEYKIVLEKKLKLYIIKAEQDLISPAYSTSPKLSMLEKLETVPIKTVREINYIKYSTNPTQCTENEIATAKAYMYNNNMMTENEKEVYENTILGD